MTCNYRANQTGRRGQMRRVDRADGASDDAGRRYDDADVAGDTGTR